jgi:nucleoside-diphosphate-sugar epimerase
VTEGRHATVFLTGATGFIGGRLAAALNTRGYRLRCLVRVPQRASALRALGAELIEGDVTDRAALAEGMRGAQLAYHMAAIYDIGVVDRATMWQANVEGTRLFLDVMREQNVARAVYVSTTVVLAPPRGDAEPQLLQPPYATEYQRTKAEAHGLAVQAQRAAAPLIIACPAFVYGPGDHGPGGRYISDLLRHRVPGLSTKPTWFSYVHVDDVVAALVAAGEQGRIGATYVLSGDEVDVNDFTVRVAKLANTWVSPLRFPPVVVKLTGIAMDAVSRLLHVRLPVSRELAALAGSGARLLHPHGRATRDLGYAPRSLAEGLPETVQDAQRRLAQ